MLQVPPEFPSVIIIIIMDSNMHLTRFFFCFVTPGEHNFLLLRRLIQDGQNLVQPGTETLEPREQERGERLMEEALLSRSSGGF